MGVKCLTDGELPTGRKALLAAYILHPASYGKAIGVYLLSFSHMQYRERRIFMSIDRNQKRIFKSVKMLTVAAMLTAMSVVIGIFCKNTLNFGNGLYRITFENLPIIMSGILFGPIVGGLVGAASDFVSYLLSAQTFDPATSDKKI